MAASDDNNKHLLRQDSDDDYLYNDDDDDDNGMEELEKDEVEDEEVLDELEIDNQQRHDNFTLLRKEDIHRVIADDIAEVSAVLSISKAEASILLLHFNWCVNKVHDAWFADEKQARAKAGLLLLMKPSIDQLPTADANVMIRCGICFDDYYNFRDEMKSTITCVHPYCNACWSSYIKSAIADGPGCLWLKCPEPSCGASVGEYMIGLFASEEEKKRYFGYIVMSYIEENNKMIKWCPGPGCENVIKFVSWSENLQVSCIDCSHSFCWNCNQEAHSPVDCETATKWISKNNMESYNVQYILAFTKPCPKCKKPIEKNKGCNHMTCRPPCSYHFCWLCLQGLDARHVCNGYRENNPSVVNNPDLERREKAKKYVMRYTHYFERWATNKKSMQKVAGDLRNVQEQQIGIIARVQSHAETHLCFLTEAWKQIVECRRFLAWTYAYGYYLSDEEEKAKKCLFEFLQGQAEAALERLHYCAEKQMQPFLEKYDMMGFGEFRQRLCGLTTVTRNYFDNLIAALTNGLSDVSSSSRVSGVPTMNTPAADSDSASHDYFAAANYIIADGPWICAYCTYVNEESATHCTMCERGSWTCDRCTFSNLRTATTCAMCDLNN